MYQKEEAFANLLDQISATTVVLDQVIDVIEIACAGSISVGLSYVAWKTYKKKVVAKKSAEPKA